jgi:FdhD protein
MTSPPTLFRSPLGFRLNLRETLKAAFSFAMDSAPLDTSVRRFPLKRFRAGNAERDLDTVAVEEPLAIRIRHWFKDRRLTETLALTMRTPGHDRELAAGLLVAEGIVRAPADIAEIYLLAGEPSNELVVELAQGVDFESWRIARASVMNSSCGVCGKRSLESLSVNTVGNAEAAPAPEFQLHPALISSLPEMLREQQAGFGQTGGLHAAALVTTAGTILDVFEDIGRHNALDKLVGACFLRGAVPLASSILFVSSRSSFELVQKAAAAGAPVLAAVGAPSSLAIDTARQYGITLIGFVRGDRFNVYSGDWRLSSK